MMFPNRATTFMVVMTLPLVFTQENISSEFKSLFSQKQENFSYFTNWSTVQTYPKLKQKEVSCTKPNDLVVVIESSAKVDQNNYDQLLIFTYLLIDTWMENPETRSSVIIYSDNGKQVYTLAESQELKLSTELGILITLADYLEGQGVNGHLGLRLAFAHLLDNQISRDGVPQALLYITASPSDDPTSTQIWTQHLIEAGVNTFSMGIGPNVNGTELETIANHKADRVFNVEDFDQIQDHLFQVSTGICKEIIKGVY